jgi:hypothetical protein
VQNVATVIVNGMVWQYIAQCIAHLPCEVVGRGLSATVRTLPATEPAGIESPLSIFITLICDLKRISIHYIGNF